MQPLTGGPRANLSEAQVRHLLQSHAPIRITYGAVALNSTFGVVADVSTYMSAGSTVSSDVTAQTQRTCTLLLDADVTDTGWSYLSGFIRPYQVFTDVETGVSAQFNLGVYTLTTPDRVLGAFPAQLSFAGYDLTYLLRQPLGDSYEVAAGTDPAQAAATVVGLAIPGVQVDVVPSGSTLPSQMTWPFNAAQPVTYLDIITTLLKSVGYRQVWADWEGVFRVEPYVDLQAETAEWTFDTAAGDNIVASGRTQNIDIYDVPNWWRFVMANLTDTALEGVSQFTYSDASAANPGSTQNRGRTIRYIEAVAVTNYTDLVNYAQSKIVALLAPAETFTVSTQPFPAAWHMDVLSYHEAELALALPANNQGSRRVLATQWSLPLDGMSDMTWTWQTITDESAVLALAVADSAASDSGTDGSDNSGSSTGDDTSASGDAAAIGGGSSALPPAQADPTYVKFLSGNMQGPYRPSDASRVKQLKPGAELIKKSGCDIFFGCEFHADNDMDKVFVKNYLNPLDSDFVLVRGSSDGGNSLVIRPSLYTATPHSINYPVGRNMVDFTVTVKATGAVFHIIGTHWFSDDDDGTSRATERMAQAHYLANYVTSLGLKNVIVAGDFNLKKAEIKALTAVLNAAGLYGLQVRSPGLKYGDENSSTGHKDGRWIDDVFTFTQPIKNAAGVHAGNGGSGSASDHNLWDRVDVGLVSES